MNRPTLADYAVEAIVEAGVNSDELVSWIANDWLDGVCQTLNSEAELEAGAHYDHAVHYINEDAATTINDFTSKEV